MKVNRCYGVKFQKAGQAWTAWTLQGWRGGHLWTMTAEAPAAMDLEEVLKKLHLNFQIVYIINVRTGDNKGPQKDRGF